MMKPFLFRQPASGTNQDFLCVKSESCLFKRCRRGRAVVVQHDGVVNLMQSLDWNTTFDAAFTQILGDTDDFFVPLHTEAIDFVVERCLCCEPNPSVSRSDQVHFMELTDQ